ncbi:unnamed protein product [Mytilus edulis]|uniref:Uncharacterized protein n=1 Tax=Mytilus edulis TaxID=6550 RepID=A0A8S3SUG0_MYTED|nr:unnamed protein product [Mytilus edulis]
MKDQPDDHADIASSGVSAEMNRKLIAKIRSKQDYMLFLEALKEDPVSANAELASVLESTDVVHETGGRGIDVFAQILRGNPDVHKNSERITMEQMTTHASKNISNRQRDNSKSESLFLESTSKYISADTQRMQTFERQKLQLQSDILDEVRNAKYSIKIAPSDLIDFGGQNTYDMTHQLFIQHKGSFC